LEFRDLVKLSLQQAEYFPHKVLGSKLWDGQIKILESIRDNRRTTVASCNAAGKSRTAAEAAISFLYTHHNSIVITTAPTYNQVVNVLWREIRGLHGSAKLPLGGDMLVDRLDLGANWYAKGFATKEPENARGWHAKGGDALVIVDEASGVPHQILDALEGAMTSPHVRMLYIGNPTQSSGRFYESHQSENWNKIRIPVFETPNFVANGVLSVDDLRQFTSHGDFTKMAYPYPTLVTPIWAWEKLMDWGEENPLFQSLVLANFPSQSVDAVFNMNAILLCMERKVSTDNIVRRVIGIDVARQGDDTSVLVPLVVNSSGNVQQLPGKARQGNRVTETVGLALELAKEIGFDKHRDTFVVDDIGVGGGVTDILYQQGYNVLGFNSSHAGDEYNLNLRAVATFDLAKAIDHEEICLIDFGKQLKHLTSLRSKISLSGKRQIESKEDIKKRIGESPDYADALIMAWHGVKNTQGTNTYFAQSSGRDTITANFLDAKF